MVNAIQSPVLPPNGLRMSSPPKKPCVLDLVFSTPDTLQLNPPQKYRDRLIKATSQEAKKAAKRSLLTGGIQGAETGWSLNGLPGALAGAIVGAGTSAVKSAIRRGALGFVQESFSQSKDGTASKEVNWQQQLAALKPGLKSCVIVDSKYLKR